MNPTSKPATEVTRQRNRQVLTELDFTDIAAFEDSRRGFIGSLETMTIHDDNGEVVWNLEPYTFLNGDAPDTANPSLWRMSQLHNIHGLFEVSPRIYQIRGFDLSNMTVVLGDEGYIVIDPLTSAESAQRGIELVRRELGDRPVTAVLYTHSHADHFGGVKGVISEQDVADGVPVIAPAGFMEHTVSENIFAGPAMHRRSQYMFGQNIAPGPTGLVSAGLGISVAGGSLTLIEPTVLVTHTGQQMTIDGVLFEFQMAPDSEAPAEMHFYLPELRALCMAENVSHHMHNVLTPRGAQVRDTAAWSDYIHEALHQYAERSDVMFISHHWPVWGTENIRTFLSQQRDMYRYIHDETLRLAAHGLTPIEIAETIAFPPALDRQWASRGYYGTLVHNSKAVYQKYLGIFDGNPANLHPHPPVEAGKRYVAFMGGADSVLRQARESFDAGDYRWVAQVVNHVVFADPQNQEATELLADTFEQLGYQAESGPWRNFYLTGALELRAGVEGVTSTPRKNELATAVTSEMLLSTIAIRLNGPQAAEHPLTIEISVTDTNENWDIELSNGVLIKSRLSEPAGNRDEYVELARQTLAALCGGRLTVDDGIASGAIRVRNGGSHLRQLLSLLDDLNPMFNIVTP